MELFNNQVISDLLSTSLVTAELKDGTNKLFRVTSSGKFVDVGKGPGSDEGKYINFLPIEHGQPKAVLEDVVRIRNHPLVPKTIPIYGYIFDVKTGKLIEVPEATLAGKAQFNN